MAWWQGKDNWSTQGNDVWAGKVDDDHSGKGWGQGSSKNYKGEEGCKKGKGWKGSYQEQKSKEATTDETWRGRIKFADSFVRQSLRPYPDDKGSFINAYAGKGKGSSRLKPTDFYSRANLKSPYRPYLTAVSNGYRAATEPAKPPILGCFRPPGE